MPKYRVNFTAHVSLSGSLVVNAANATDAADIDIDSICNEDLQGSWFRAYESVDSIDEDEPIQLDDTYAGYVHVDLLEVD